MQADAGEGEGIVIKHDCQPNSLQWLELRAGKVTASEAKHLVTPKWKIRTGEMVETLLATKLAERWLGPLPGFTAWSTEQGQLLEETAIPAYEFEYGVKVERVGFITDDAGRIGCSPDGMLEGYGLEIKSLQPVHHIKCLINGEALEDYLAQVHFSMLVTGLPAWKLFLYHRRLPQMQFRIERDPDVQEVLQVAVERFLERLDAEWAYLCERNGGPPPPRKPFIPSSPDDPRKELFQPVPFDLIP